MIGQDELKRLQQELAETRRAAEEMLSWADQRDDELARPHGVRARHYLEHGTWMTKAEARR